jgi:hypothetical protein
MDATVETRAAQSNPAAKVRCSDWARSSSLSPIGTIGTYAGYLLVEIALPWPRDVGETSEGVAVRSLIEPLGYRLQAIAPSGRGSRPQDRRVILHARPVGEPAFAGYRRFEASVGDSLVDTVATLIAAAAVATPSDLEVAGVDVLVCTHGGRDACCGKYGANLAVALAAAALPPEVNLLRTSHTGGHRFAPTFMLLPQGTSWGLADADIVNKVISRKGDVAGVASHYRGCTGLAGPEIQALELAVLLRVGWSLLDQPRSGSFDGTHAELSWQENEHVIRWRAEVHPGRAVPMPGCLQPAQSAVKAETEWAVTALHRI